MKQRLLELLGVEHPILEGGLAYIGDGRLAAAVSNAGGFGQVGSAGRSLEDFEKQIQIAIESTNKPFGVNLPIGEHSDPSERVELILKYKQHLRAVSISAGNPRPFIPVFQAAGLPVMVVISTAMHAQKAEQAGADILIAEGYEAGGHNGPSEVTTFALIPQVASCVSVPVIAAGGVADGRGLVAALALGAAGVQLGTRLVATVESPAHEDYKQKIVAARAEDTTMIERSVGRVTRVLKAPYVNGVLTFERTFPSSDELYPLVKGEKNRIGALEGDLEHGFAYSGQGCGLIHSIPTVADVISTMVEEARAALRHLPTL
ncbi:NAD(P)H-dependent flavin oxidoreductase [Tumebacillus permanentifrigoris]|uniref:Probable nitronate monooxygenase n=1 Tax=Tumebacillus permanentifrigoris TaxID=378543 RepID=A0A316DA41_9BACL|nr:nitronate monooxygenase family protein [Tumebacillus permanentifrigoris]PWK14355.1 enoyl-[acyl-carrier protein] reductase II [Tumebacillus permanentifrigoris]